MIRLIILSLLTSAPALAASTEINRRTMPELSDIALAGMAALGIWLAQRAMRRRAAIRRAQADQTVQATTAQPKID